ncbi:hypothetical protein [Aeromonas dhakensis]|uniref:hypothetical protein n=1 Tax=Aeromonas dhakensis TaxID=196024 RepID=UPI003F7A2FBA
MAEPFALLTRIFSDDQQWENFIRSAWAAHQDFAKSRDKSNRAADQAGVVVNAIETVVNAIDHFSDIGISGPDELYSIPALLGQTDNHADRGRNLHMWRGLRGYLLGDQPEREMPKAKPALVSDEPFTTLDVQFIPADEIMVTDPAIACATHGVQPPHSQHYLERWQTKCVISNLKSQAWLRLQLHPASKTPKQNTYGHLGTNLPSNTISH